MNNICAVVVTYNRKELLQGCIRALMAQSIPVDIMVVDNASTDGTKDVLTEWIRDKKIIYYNTGDNLGGAGGFYCGIKKAMRQSYEYLWLMDDDTFARHDAAKQLYDAALILKNEFGYLASTVFFNEKELCEMNRPGVSSKWYSMEKYQFMKKGLINIYYASFVSLFLRTEVVEQVGLPLKEFFIWNDDYEYTTRISKLYENYLVCDSVVEHKMKLNQTTDILTDHSERIERYFYNYRNGFYIAKRDGHKAVIRYILTALLVLSRILFGKSRLKGKKCRIVIKGMMTGIWFHPEVEYIKRGV